MTNCTSGACKQARDLYDGDRLAWTDYMRGLCPLHRRLEQAIRLAGEYGAPVHWLDDPASIYYSPVDCLASIDLCEFCNGPMPCYCEGQSAYNAEVAP